MIRERDPAADPLPGDVFVKLGAQDRKLRRYVLEREDMQVVYRTDDETRKPRTVWLPTFQEWARCADVDEK